MTTDRINQVLDSGFVSLRTATLLADSFYREMLDAIESGDWERERECQALYNRAVKVQLNLMSGIWTRIRRQ